ncbi:precorrin-2 dehydrogenase/sirohydrochlorin ferrochelatase family protein [Paenibacillus rigui]|uniref:precorrin-2 dehydrogenase n=1 Tax=Paenibacillus rigui TaxID=554312 RepID=A0A229UTC3_9BACL|nr:bifunctional precorrin-2 dehydrogenase/sirohydrochlorin ferrochelatase [Paenibacillus rigui]OXM86877.1 siroheme synthase [Paenibacillus rigui]
MDNPTNPTELHSLNSIDGSQQRYYPLLVDLWGKPCVIVGGGTVAERKAQGLLEAGGRITVISPVCSPQLQQWGLDRRLTLKHESYRAGMPELEEALLIFAATDQPQVNEAVRLEAQALGKLVNSTDHAEQSGFIVPAVVRRGKLLLTVSTSGASPAVARKVRQELEQVFGTEYELYLDLLHELRAEVQMKVGETKERQDIFRHMLGWRLLDWIRSGSFDDEARGMLVERVSARPSVTEMDAIGDWINRQLENRNE